MVLSAAPSARPGQQEPRKFVKCNMKSDPKDIHQSQKRHSITKFSQDKETNVGHIPNPVRAGKLFEHRYALQWKRPCVAS